MRWGCGCGSFRAGVRVISGFSAYFAPLFGRRERGSTAVIISRPCWYSLGSGATLRTCRRRFRGARGMQRFLTDSPWDDEVIIGRLQEYLGTRLEQPEGVWVLDGSDFPKAGEEVGGSGPAVLREAGEGGQLPGGDVPGLCQPVGTGIGGQGAVSARELDLGQRPV